MLKSFVEILKLNLIISGSLFPPRDLTKEDVVHVFDKDLCRTWPLRYRWNEVKDGITVGRYTPDDNAFTYSDRNSNNKCFCPGRQKCPPDGLQDISPCQFGKYLKNYFRLYYKC